MQTAMRQVYSDVVYEIGYSAESKKLFVTWKRGGKTSSYSGVPADVADQVMNAPSIGQALSEQIKGQYDHRYE